MVADSTFSDVLNYTWCDGEMRLSRPELCKLIKQRFHGQSTHRYRSAAVERFIDKVSLLHAEGRLPKDLTPEQVARLRRMTRPLRNSDPVGVEVTQLRTEMRRMLEQLVPRSSPLHVMHQIPVSI